MRKIEEDYKLRQSRIDSQSQKNCCVDCHQVVVDGGFEIVNQDEPVGNYLTDMMPVTVLASK